MTRSYEECQSLYRAAKAEERPRPADRRLVHAALMATVAAGVQITAAGAASAAIASNVTPALGSALGAGAGAGAGAGSATVVGVKGLVQLLAGGKFLTGLLVGAVVGTAVSATAFVAMPPKPPAHASNNAPNHAPNHRVAIASKPEARPRAPIGQQAQPSLPSAPREANAEPAREISPGISRDPRPLTAPPVPPVVPPATASADSLLEETRALARVQDALSRNAPKEAWALLKAQDLEFAQGQLGEERAAAKILTLCASGQDSEAEQARSRFISAHPGSPLTHRVMKACAH